MKIHESYKYVVWIILLLIISPNVRSQIDKNKKQINVLDFGAIPNDGKHDTQALRNAVKLARETPNSILFFPKGIYHISDSLALKIQDDAMSGKLGENPQDQLFVSNRVYAIGLDFEGAKNLIIQAEGVQLICDGWMEPLSFRNAQDITLNGITIDYKRRPNSHGEIISLGDDFVDVKFTNSEVLAKDQIILRIMIYDKENQSFTGAGVYHSRKEWIAPKTIRFFGKSIRERSKLGNVLLTYSGFHYRPAILIYKTKNIDLNNVTIHAQAGMGIVGHLSENITMNRLRIVPSEGRYASSNTDATHFASNRGLIRFNQCEFGGQGDDATNVHTYYTQIANNDAARKQCDVMVDRNIQSRFLFRNDKSKLKAFNDSIAELNSKMFEIKTVLIPGFDNKGMEDWLELNLNDGEFSKNNFDDSSWDSWLPRNTSKESRNSGSFEAVLTHENEILSDGVIWFRTKIKLENIESEYNLIIEEGIDDLDQTYFNGQLIGSTIGWDKARNYKIPKQILIKGENTIAIRVFDGGGPGGINGIIKVRNSLSSQVIPFSSFKFKHQAFIANKKLWVHNYSFEDLIKNSSMLQKNIKREIIKLNNSKNYTHSSYLDEPQAGDVLAVIDKNTLEEKGYIKVRRFWVFPLQDKVKIEYDGELPKDTGNYYLINISMAPQLEFENCTVHSHRARSVLVKTRKVLIRNNEFSNTTGTAIHVGVEGDWGEGMASEDVIITGNVFNNCGLGGSNDGTIEGASAIALHVKAPNTNVAGLHKRILIENNVINGGKHAIVVKGSEDVTIRNNSFKEIDGQPIIIGASIRVKAYNNEGGQLIGEKLAPPALPNLN